MRLAPVLLAFGAWALCAMGSARAADQPEACPKLHASGDVRVLPAALTKDELRLTFVGHATFIIETPRGVRIATDYNDYVRPDFIPDVITMNKAHSTHFTNNVPSSIGTVLRGWNPAGRPAVHDVTVEDVRIRNVVTNIRDWSGGTEYDGNSMFVFEAAGLCVAHLGHLHHELTEEHLKQLGRIDVALAPVDGSYTLDMSGMTRVLQSLGAPLVIPMHYFGQSTLERFLSIASEEFTIERSESPTLIVSRDTLPRRPTIRVLPGR
jgi:L-ascorbate metabolism protein UlaG (beta-lactamase superfamily)